MIGLRRNSLLPIFALLFFVFFSLNSSFANVRLPAVISSGMVLQQRSEDPLWGWASPGEEIAITANWAGSTTVKTKADSNGRWRTKIKMPAAGGPFTITVKANNTILLENVLIGEVWVCSGQSNMEMPLSGWPGAAVKNSSAEIKAAEYPEIRLFTVKRNAVITPQEDCVGSWSACTPESVASFSATAYFFGRQLFRELKVPIGLIHSSWGGTVAQAWTSADRLRKLGDFDLALDKLDSIRPHIEELKKEDERNMGVWNRS